MKKTNPLKADLPHLDNIPPGFCKCGCGQRTPMVGGTPLPYCNASHNPKHPYNRPFQPVNPTHAIPKVKAPDTPIQRPFPACDATSSLSHVLAWVAANPKFLAEQRKRHGTYRIESIKRYIANRRKTDVGFRLLMNLRCRIHAALKSAGKSKRTMQLVGCSIAELRAHLEGHFRPGMSWSNYGEWHVDHIIPCRYFDLTRPAEQKRCFHYTNLQPLWSDDNFKKGGRIARNA